MFRRRYLFLLIVMFIVLCFIFAINSYDDFEFFGIGSVTLLDRHRRKGKGIINTEGCTIPDLDPMDPSVKSFVKYPSDLPQCPNATLALLDRNRTTIWVREENFHHYNITEADELSCCYRAFYRPVSVKDITADKIDNRVEYDDCITFNDTIDVKDEFVRVNCSVNDTEVYEQFYLFAPEKNFIKLGEKHEITNKTGYNVLVVGVDSVSRLNFLRTMPKLVKYLKTKGAIDMLGYNKVGYNTFPNLIPMFLGVKKTEVDKVCYPHRKATFDNCPFVWQWYKQAGYYTAFAEDLTPYATFNYLKRGFAAAPTDYYARTLLREAEVHVGTGEKMCMNDIYYYKVLLNYMEDVTWRLQSKRLFGLFWENTMSHDHLNWPMRMDEDYVKMFYNLEASGYLEETIVFFVSDHGIRWGSIRSTKQGHLEERLPFLYVMTPLSFQENYRKAYNSLKINSQRLTTPFDLYETLMDLVDAQNVEDKRITERYRESYALKRGISLFLPIPSNRTCKDAAIDDQWCTCKREVHINTNHPKAVEASRLLVKAMNYKLEDYALCAKLELTRVVDAMEIQVGEMDKDNPWREFMVVVKTAPSNAVFEAMLRFHVEDKTWQLAGPPSRLNQYGEQSWCMDDYDLKAFCYCY